MGLADKLGITKSSTFVATVHIHELAQVPLVTGRFRLKWKFKNVNSSYQLDADEHDTVGELRRGFLHPLNALQAGGHHNNNSSAGARSRSRSHSPAAHLAGAREYRDSADEETASSSYTQRANRSRTRSSSPPLDSQQTPNPNKTPLASSSHQFTGFSNSTPFGSSNANEASSGGGARSSSVGHGYNSSVDEGGPTPTVHRRGGGDLIQGAHPAHAGSVRAEPKGTTNMIPLNNHVCVFERAIHCPISIPLRSSSAAGANKLMLQPSPVRLAIRQELPGNHFDNKREEHKIGEIELDLSQFVGNGKGVEQKPRRYLLRHSATNATLKVTVRMEFVGGESNFVAPAFKNAGQARGKSAGLLDSSTTSLNSSKTNLNRSNSSLGVGQRKTPQGAGLGVLDRTHSSSTVSSQSGPSSKSGSLPKPQKRGWHPPSTSLAHNPGALGNSHASTELSAADLIESIFNPPPTRPHHTKAAAALRRAQTETGLIPQVRSSAEDGDDDDDESEHEASGRHLSPDNSLSFTAKPKPRPKLVQNVKSGETIRNSAPPSFAVGFNQPQPRKPDPPSRQATFGSNTSSSSSGSIMQHPIRQHSAGSTGTGGGPPSRPLSVRWGDDTPPASSPASPQGLGLSAGSSPAGSRGVQSRPSSLRLSSSGTVPSLKHQSSNSSMRSGSSLRFAGSENSTPSTSTPKRTASGVSFAGEKSGLSKSVTPAAEQKVASGGGGGIEWNQSWGK